VTICCAFRLNQYIFLRLATREREKSLSFPQRDGWRSVSWELMLGANMKGHTMTNHWLSLRPWASPPSLWGCPSAKPAALNSQGKLWCFGIIYWRVPGPQIQSAPDTQTAVVTKPSSVGTCSSADKPCSTGALMCLQPLFPSESQPDFSSQTFLSSLF